MKKKSFGGGSTTSLFCHRSSSIGLPDSLLRPRAPVMSWPLDCPKSCMTKPFARMIYAFFMSKIDAWVQLEISAKNIKQLGEKSII